MRPPTIVIASLSAIAITGMFFAITSLFGGAGGIAALYAALPVAAFACSRVKRFSRTSLFLVALAAMGPLMVGVMLTWPHLGAAAPYLLGIGALFGGLAGMLSPIARAWHATASAYRLLDL
jgi:hypothetical protein